LTNGENKLPKYAGKSGPSSKSPISFYLGSRVHVT